MLITESGNMLGKSHVGVKHYGDTHILMNQIGTGLCIFSGDEVIIDEKNKHVSDFESEEYNASQQN